MTKPMPKRRVDRSSHWVEKRAMSALPRLPISDVLPDIKMTLESARNLVLVAPPGAGKTTLVPMALLVSSWLGDRKIIVLEPRRLAARAAASRMASLLGEKVGETVGYRVRFDTKVSSKTRIEVVTEGVFTRMLASDPSLEHIGAVLFDEFHERSLDSDLALALCLDLQEGLRDDLRLLAMSATLDGTAVADLMRAQVIESAGRSFPVEIVHCNRKPDEQIEAAVTAAVVKEIATSDGQDILVFLPGQAEIERTFSRLEERLPDHIDLRRLYGAVSHQAQDAALRKAPEGRRKVVLSSAIAETSLTIDGVTTVIDSGLSRQPVFEPATGLTRLETVRASQASVTQRAGRAGRLAPGRAVRLWHEGQTAALPKSSPPEILNADLAPLLLDLADWGVTEPVSLRWLDAPPAPALAEARRLLQDLGALDDAGSLTAHGRAIHAAPLPPRLAHMVQKAKEHSQADAFRASLLALLLQERGAGETSTDLQQRRETCERSKQPREKRLVQMARRIAGAVVGHAKEGTLSDGILLAHGFADRIANRAGRSAQGNIRYRLANGRGAELDTADPLAREEWLVVVDMTGRAGAARIVAAAAINKSDILEALGNRISEETTSQFDVTTGALKAEKRRRLGQIDLAKAKPVAVDDVSALAAMLGAVRENGTAILPWCEKDVVLRNRLALLHEMIGEPWPDLSEEHLLETLDDWLAPFLDGERSFDPLANGALSDALTMLAGHPPMTELDRLVPTHFVTPAGSNAPLAYGDKTVTLSVRPQELFGLDVHPTILDGRLSLSIELLSPAGRPIQLTQSLPGFWRGSWADVRADLRGTLSQAPLARGSAECRTNPPRKTAQAMILRRDCTRRSGKTC